MKRLISVICALLLLVSALSMGTMAATGSGNLEVTAVSLTGTNSKRPLSKAEVNTYLKDGYEIDFDNDGVMDIALATFNRYNFLLKLSNGKTSVVNSDRAVFYNVFGIIDDSHFAIITPYVSGAAYKTAVKNASQYLYVSVDCAVYNADYNALIKEPSKMIEIVNKPAFKKTFKLKYRLVDRFVTKIEAVSGVPKAVYEDADYVALDGAKFSVTYYNGTTRTYAVKRNSPLDMELSESESLYYYCPDYTMNNEEFYCEIDKNKLCFEFADAPLTYTSVKVYPCPYEKIEIKDCKFGDDIFGDGKGVEYLSCDITQKNGKVVNIITEIDKPISVGVAAELNGYYLNFYADSASIIPEKFGGNTVVGVDFAGLDDEFNSSEASDATLLSKLMAKLEAAINALIKLLPIIYLPF